MGNVTRSDRKDKDNAEDNNTKGNNGKKLANSGVTTAVRRSPRETLSKKSMTPLSFSGTRKSERLEKQTLNSNLLTSPAKRKSERIEKQKNPSPLRRSERSKTPYSSSSSGSGSKKSDNSLNSLNMKRKKEKREKTVKQLTMETVEVNKIEKEDGRADEVREKKVRAPAYGALWKNVNGTDHSDDLNRTDGEGREKDVLKQQTGKAFETAVPKSTSQSVKEALENDNEPKLFPTTQGDICKDMSSNGDGQQISKGGSVAREVDGDAEKATLENLQKQELVNSKLHVRILDCNISSEKVQEVMPSERKRDDIDVDSVASLSNKDIYPSTAGSGTLLTSGCKRKDCSDTSGMPSKRKRVDCDSTKQETCSSNIKLNQFVGSSDVKDRGKLDSSFNMGHAEKPSNDIQKHIFSKDIQQGAEQNTCIICKLGGKLLCCDGKGCQRSYHLSCLEPPLKEAPLGVWHCPVCVRKKIESGVHSVSEGIETIWDFRELEALEDGLQRQKQYFVKYKGLAHVHNRWVPENQVLLEAPSLVAKYNRRNQGAVWKQHWAVPHRVLQNRLLMTPKECVEHHHKEHDGDKLECHAEWLVKWCGLGYEHASWELENAPFFRCPEGESLLQDYETRREKAKTTKFDKEREVAFKKLSQLPAAISSGLNANLDAVIKLCNYWRKGQNAVIFDDQERIPNVISVILSLLSDTSRPFLIISTSTSQHSWDEEFLHLAPSADVVVYSGSKKIREKIRSLQFYEGGCIMFQVLITSPEVISEDLSVLGCIGWEAIIMDECQRPRIASCFEQTKMLTASKRLLIVSSQLKDNTAEYLGLLSLLDSQSDLNDSDSLLMNSSDVIGTLKERLAKYVAYECKLDSSRFAEYWVPVLLSGVQIEQYCFTLLSNSLSLCSPSKTDPVGALRNILISSRKCCDHPYVVDQSLQMMLTKDLRPVEFLDVGIKASGKLQLLDAMLLEIKKRELKVLILFQSIGGSGRELMGDILDDFLRQRFGADSYERVDGGLIPSKKQSALNKFKNERQRFVFLLETRACLPSIKLSAVAAVIIFGSDWNPMNDIRALQRITFDSQFEHIKVFRLYSSFTVEEKVLMLSKQDKTLDSTIQNISPTTSHTLLKWVASYLFSQLDKFHGMPTLDAGTLSEQTHLKDVINEFFTILDQTEIDNDASSLSLILRAKQNRGVYGTEMPLFGEQKIQVMNEDPPYLFWIKLLDGKSPQWKYTSCSSQRSRKKVQHYEPEAESTEIVKKRKKGVSDCNDLSPKAGLHEGKLAGGDREGSSGSSACGLSHPLSRSAASESDKIHVTSNSLLPVNNISKIPALDMAELEARRKLRDSQKNLHGVLKPQIAKLCEVLHLSDDVKAMVERFLEYVMNNHLVSSEAEPVLQAFQISLCWSAASLLKHKIDHKESLALAKQHLGFTCKKEEADYIHLMLKCVKRMFLYHTGNLKVPNSPKASERSSKAVGRDVSIATSNQEKKAKIEDVSGIQEASGIQACAEPGMTPEFQLAQRDLLKSIKEIEKKCDKHMKKLLEKQKEEMEQFTQKYDEEKARLENKKRTEAAVIRLHSNFSTITDKLKKLDNEYARKFDELKGKMDLDLKNLENKQVAARSECLERKTTWVEAVKSWARVELVWPPVTEVNPSEGASSAGVTQSVSGSEVRLSKLIHIDPDEVTACSYPINQVALSPEPDKENSEGSSLEERNVTVSSAGAIEQAVCKALCPGELASVGKKPDGGAASSADVMESIPPMRSSDEDQISNGSKLNMSNGDPEIVPPFDGPDNLISAEAPSCRKKPDGATLSKPNSEIPLRAAECVSFSESEEKLASLHIPSSEKSCDRDRLREVDGEVPFREYVTVISSEVQEKLVSIEEPPPVEVLDGSNLIKDGGQVAQVSLMKPMLANSGEGQEDLHSSEAPSSDEIPDGHTLSTAAGMLPSSVPEPSSEEIPDGHALSTAAGMLPSSVPEPSSEEIPNGHALSMAAGMLPSSVPETVTSSDGHENIMSAKCSSDKQIPVVTAFGLPDGEKSPDKTSEIAASSCGIDIVVCRNPSSSKEQMPDIALLSTPAEEVALAEPEKAPLDVDSVHRENDATSSIGIDMRDGEVCTMNQESEFSAPALADVPPLQRVPTPDQGDSLPQDQVSPNVGSLPSASSAKQGGDVANVETQSASQVAKTSVSIAAIDARCNESNLDTPVVALGEQLELLGSGESTSNLSSPDLPSVSPNVGSLPSASSAKQGGDVANVETQSASQVAKTSASIASIDARCNESNLDTPVVVLGEQFELLGSGESTSNHSPPDLPSVSPNVGSLSSASSAKRGGDVANVETQSASQVAKTSASIAAIDARCNESNLDTPVVALGEQMEFLGSEKSTSNHSSPDLPSVSAIEHQSSNEGQTANQISQTTRQSVANHIEVSNQDVLQALHSPIDSAIGGPVRHALETGTASIPSVSSGLPVQSTTGVSSWVALTLHSDPLQNELERIRMETDQTIKIHEDTKLQLKSECEKEIELVVAQIRRKYEAKLQEKEAEFMLQKKELDVNYNKVLLSKILAEAFRSKCMDSKASGSAGVQQEASSFMQQLVQLSSQQTVTLHSTASILPSVGSTSSMQTVSPVISNTQTMTPPLQVVHPSAVFSGTPTRPPHISSFSPSTGNLQMSGEIRAPAPHLQPFRPSTSVSPSSLPSQSRGMPSQQAYSIRPVASSLLQSYSNPLIHRQASTPCQSGRIRPETAGGLAALSNSSLSGVSANPPNSMVTLVHRQSSLPSIRPNLAQQSGATDIVCLSDDD